MSQTVANIDVVELCALLQCVGYRVEKVEVGGCNVNEDSGVSVVINCHSSGLRVALEKLGSSCSCPATSADQNSGFWEICGVSGGKHLDKEVGSTFLGSLPKVHREFLSKQMSDLTVYIKQHHRTEEEKSKELTTNKSASAVELGTPEKRLQQLKEETPTRYRSLDTLTASNDTDPPLPMPGLLQKHSKTSTPTKEEKCNPKLQMCNRQGTYTLSNEPDSIRERPNETSSPIQVSKNVVLKCLTSIEKVLEKIWDELQQIRESIEKSPNESSISSIDVSKISVLKAGDSSRTQFSSSPNLYRSGIKDTSSKSASTSNLARNKLTVDKENKFSRLPRLSPMFRLKKDKSGVKEDKTKTQQIKKGLLQARIVKPVRPTLDESSTSLTKKKKTNIPTPNSK